MPDQTRLSGFKILNDVVWISLTSSHGNKEFPVRFCNLLAGEAINIPFLTCGNEGLTWGVDIVVDLVHAPRISKLVEDNFGGINQSTARAAVLSLFPHRNNPVVAADLLNAFGKEGIEPEALAHSNSAISVVLREELMGGATRALFNPFCFSAYRTPADWKLAQKGKEELFKEVVASYQEKRPKVYALEWQKGQELLQLKLNTRNLSAVGTLFSEISRIGMGLSFLISTPSTQEREAILFFSLPASDQWKSADIIKALLPDALAKSMCPVGLFSMNGPHFGDRHGIASELLKAFSKAEVHMPALSCSIHSVSGIVPESHITKATRAIKGCFEVPAVIEKKHPAG